MHLIYLFVNIFCTKIKNIIIEAEKMSDNNQAKNNKISIKPTKDELDFAKKITDLIAASPCSF